MDSGYYDKCKSCRHHQTNSGFGYWTHDPCKYCDGHDEYEQAEKFLRERNERMTTIPPEIFIKLSPDGHQRVLTTEDDPEGVAFVKMSLYNSIDRIRLKHAQKIQYLLEVCARHGVTFED